MHRLALSALLACVLSAARAQDASLGTYALEGQDSQGNVVRGTLVLRPNGNFERTVKAPAPGGERRDRTAGRAQVEGDDQRKVFTFVGSLDRCIGLSGSLLEASGPCADRTGPPSREHLVVTWTAPGEVQVEYSKGDYRSTEHGVRAYALREVLFDEPTPSAEIGYVLQAPGHDEQLRYRRQATEDAETRTYTLATLNGKARVAPGATQQLTRSGFRYTPQDGATTAALADSGLAKSTYAPTRLSDVLPARALRVGESWELPQGPLGKFLNLPGKIVGGGVRGTLVAVEPAEGGLRYTLTLAVDLEVDLSQHGFRGPATLRGEIRARQTPTTWVAAASLALQGDLKGNAFEQKTSSRFAVKNHEAR
ncbi:MAG: hypothetical protein R3F62_20740 [Planctomycetota bacterium]